MHSLLRFGMRPGLDRVRELLSRLGDPQRRLPPVVHITGTNGKGSVAAMAEACLRAGGLKTGLYLSPYLERFNERIQINRRPIANRALARLLSEVRPHIEAMVAAGHESPTEFEVITAAAFLHFSRVQADALVLEVGLGGRFDATTAAPSARVTVITNVSLDHTEVLGDSVAAIAWDKAGIMRPGVPCVTAATGEALAVLRRVAKELGAPLIEVAPAGGWRWRSRSAGLTGQRFYLQGPEHDYGLLPCRLLGEHQLANAACAVAALEAGGFGLAPAALARGLGSVRWPGRLEVLHRRPLVLLDGAHNAAGAAALARAVRAHLGRGSVWVMAMMADKEVDAVLDHLAPLATCVLATAVDHPRALPAAALAERLQGRGVTAVAVAQPAAAAAMAWQRACRDNLALVAAGSLYLIGAVRPVLCRLLGSSGSVRDSVC